MIRDEVGEVNTDMSAQPLDYVKPKFVQEQAELTDRVTLDTALVAEPTRSRIHGDRFAKQEMDRPC